MTVVIRHSLDGDALPTLRRVVKMSSVESGLGARRLSEVQVLYAGNQIVFAVEGRSVLAWILLIDHGNDAQELAGAYVDEGSRGRGLLDALVGEAVERRPVSVAVVANDSLARWATTRWGFMECTMLSLLKVTRGSIALDRLRPSRLHNVNGYHARRHARFLVRQSSP